MDPALRAKGDVEVLNIDFILRAATITELKVIDGHLKKAQYKIHVKNKIRALKIFCFCISPCHYNNGRSEPKTILTTSLIEGYETLSPSSFAALIISFLFFGMLKVGLFSQCAAP